MDKPFKTFEEQVEILSGIGNNKFRMKTDEHTLFHLQRYNYYSIINFYKEPFLIGKDSKGEDIYKDNVHFNHLKILYDFDKELRILFFDVLTQLENFFKTIIAYYFSETYREKESYLKLENYYIGQRNENVHILSKIIKNLNYIKKDTDKIIIKHYNVTKDNIPFWITIHFLTFGKIGKLYLIQNQKVCNKIISHCRNLYKKEYGEFSSLTNKFIKTFLKSSTLFRNIAAHNERIYDSSVKNTIKIDNVTGITNNKKQKLFTIYEGLKLFLPKTEYEKLTLKLKELINELEEKLENVIDINNILKKMDFPTDWHKNTGMSIV